MNAATNNQTIPTEGMHPNKPLLSELQLLR